MVGRRNSRIEAVMRLVEAGVLNCVDKKPHTGKARKFHFSGQEHEHYEVESPMEAKVAWHKSETGGSLV